MYLSLRGFAVVTTDAEFTATTVPFGMSPLEGMAESIGAKRPNFTNEQGKPCAICACLHESFHLCGGTPLHPPLMTAGRIALDRS